MGDWKDDKDSGSWDFTEQPDKWGYLNNPRWTEDSESNQHDPCGHWHKNKFFESTGTYITYQLGSWWQQTVDVGDDGNIYLGVPNYDYNQFSGIKSDPIADVDSIQIVSEYVDDPVYNDGNPYIDETEFDSLAIVPPTIVRCSTYTILVGLVWGKEDGDGDYTSAIVCGVKRDDVNQGWKVVVNKFGQAFKDGDIGDVTISYSHSAVALDDGVIIISYQYQNSSAGTDNLCVIRSIDYGDTWGSEIVIDSDVDDDCKIKMGDNGDIYISYLDSTTANVYISTDKGLNWTEKNTPVIGSSPTSAWGDIDHDVDANGVIYVLIGRSWTFSLYVSSDGGNNWTKHDNSQTGRTCIISANTTAIIIHGFDLSDFHGILIKSTDGGVNFTEKVDVYALGHTSIPYQTLKHTGTTFIWTYCAMVINAGSEIAWLISDDNGDTWIEDSIVDLMSFVSVDDTQEILVDSVEEEFEEPQVWALPGEEYDASKEPE